MTNILSKWLHFRFRVVGPTYLIVIIGQDYGYPYNQPGGVSGRAVPDGYVCISIYDCMSGSTGREVDIWTDEGETRAGDAPTKAHGRK